MADKKISELSNEELFKELTSTDAQRAEEARKEVATRFDKLDKAKTEAETDANELNTKLKDFESGKKQVKRPVITVDGKKYYVLAGETDKHGNTVTIADMRENPDLAKPLIKAKSGSLVEVVTPKKGGK